jgi:hypothetical protein
MVRFQDDVMMGIAKQRPRAITEIRGKLMAELEAFPEFADRYYYSIPYKSKKCRHATGELCPECTLVEGASIHAALAIQRYWGNCFSSWAPMEETEEHIWLMGTFVDYEMNTKVVRPVRAQKGYTTRATDSKPAVFKPHFAERLSQAINAAGSKAQRNAILAGVPDALKILVFTSAKQLVVGDEPAQLLTPEQHSAIAKEFAKFEVGLELLASKLGKPIEEWAMRDRATLLGLRTALSDGAARDELFADTIKKTQSKPRASKKPTPTPQAEAPSPPPATAAEELAPPEEQEAAGESPPPVDEPASPAAAPDSPDPLTANVPSEDDPFTATLFDD